MENRDTVEELQAALGEQLRSLRIRKVLDQRQVSERAGIALNAVKRLEGGKGATLASLISVLRVLQRTDWLATLAPVVSVDPLQMLRTAEPRKRAIRKVKPKNV